MLVRFGGIVWYKAYPDAAQVALEMSVVHGVKTDDCGEEADICFGQAIADEEILPPSEDTLELVE